MGTNLTSYGVPIGSLFALCLKCSKSASELTAASWMQEPLALFFSVQILSRTPFAKINK